MSAMAESSSYNNHHAGRQQLYPQEWTSSTNWTPQSAVSSFNFPQQCDSSLMTPVSTAASASSRLAPIKQESPSSTTPTSNYHYFSPDEEYLNSRPKNTMKYKGPLAHLPPTSNDLPLSPLDVPTPYWGPYCVSANTTASHHSPTLNSSPSLNASAGTQSTPSTYRVPSQAPILIAPTPQALRPANRYTDDLIRQNSFDSGQSSTPRSAHVFQGPGHSPFLIDQEVIGPLPQGRKRRSTSRRGDDGDRSDSNSEKSRQDALLVQLRNHERRQWKEVRDKFNETTGLSMKIPALEMRLKRYKERSRSWTEVDDNALALSHAEVSKHVWKMVADGMLKYGVSEVWSKDTVKRKWEDSNFEETGPPRIFYEPRHQKRCSRDRESSSWSLESAAENGTHEGEDASMSARGIDDNRSRINNSSNTHYQQGSQHQSMNEEKP